MLIFQFSFMSCLHLFDSFFFFNDTATTEIYTCLHTLSLHDALPISGDAAAPRERPAPPGASREADARGQQGARDPDHHGRPAPAGADRSEEHTSELQSLMRISYAVFCLKKKNNQQRIET